MEHERPLADKTYCGPYGVNKKNCPRVMSSDAIMNRGRLPYIPARRSVTHRSTWQPTRVCSFTKKIHCSVSVVQDEDTSSSYINCVYWSWVASSALYTILIKPTLRHTVRFGPLGQLEPYKLPRQLQEIAQNRNTFRARGH